MRERPYILVDENIPFIAGRLEPHAEVEYIDQDAFTPARVREADALLIRTRTRCNRTLLGESDVKLVATATIGTDQIDKGWCAANGITVRNSPGCNAPGVAQYVWASLIHMGLDPKGMKIGVVGYGNVGSIVAAWGRRMGAEVRVCDPPRLEAGHTDVEYEPLGVLLRECDVVTLHTPLINDGPHPTLHLIDASGLSLMKPGAVLVNAARGPVVDTRAVCRAIREKGLRAVIDTWEGEPKPDPELLELCETGTFHIAGYSLEGKQRATRMVLEATDAFFGWETDKSGLALARPQDEAVTAQAIARSYNPKGDMEALLREPEAFERLRHDYEYRPEPVF